MALTGSNHVRCDAHFASEVAREFEDHSLVHCRCTPSSVFRRTGGLIAAGWNDAPDWELACAQPTAFWRPALSRRTFEKDPTMLKVFAAAAIALTLAVTVAPHPAFAGD